jgi:hypothetical protein
MQSLAHYHEAQHSDASYSLGTALGFRLHGGLQTNIPEIIVFVARKVYRH